MKYFFIAGEASGDLHGSSLINELKKLDNACEIHFLGGDLMRAVTGVRPIKHIKGDGLYGFLECVEKSFNYF